MRDLLDLVNEMSEEGLVEVQDSFDFELSEDFVIETGVVDINEDGILIEGDEETLRLLAEHGLILEETDWSKYDEPTASRIKKGKTKPVDKTDYNKPTHLRKKEEKKDMEEGVLDQVRNKMNDKGNNIKNFDAQTGKPLHATSTISGIRAKMNKPGQVQEKMVMGLPGDGGSKVMGEGMTKDAMMDDAEKMSLEEFCDKYGDEDWVKEFYHTAVGDLDEAKYQGREVPLGKPMAGDVKKSKVYVRGPKGNVVKVNFGDKKMRIKKSNPNRRKSFRARHNCDNPGPRWKARYWSCRAW